MNRSPMALAVAGLLALSITACSGSGDSAGQTEDPNPAGSSPSGGQAESDGSSPAGPAVEARVVVTSDGDNASHTIKERSDDEVNFDEAFDSEAELHFDNGIESVYVTADGDDSKVTCEVWYDDEKVAEDEAHGEPARCWAPPVEG